MHEPGDLRRAIHEATRHKVGMLSYSPRQMVTGFWQRTLMPLVFCELALAYPPAKVSDPNQRVAAANGQFLLVEREAYRRMGGHPAVADRVLEDVELALLAKRRKVGLRFRYADGCAWRPECIAQPRNDRRLDAKISRFCLTMPWLLPCGGRWIFVLLVGLPWLGRRAVECPLQRPVRWSGWARGGCCSCSGFANAGSLLCAGGEIELSAS